jgi:GntR family transcriptional regulator
VSKSIFAQTKDKLLSFISNQKLPGNKLPAEEELAERLKVSRGTIREVLRSLNKEGIISKKHGFGNFVQNSALKARMRIEQLEEFYDLIEDGGYKASIHIEKGSYL